MLSLINSLLKCLLLVLSIVGLDKQRNLRR